MALDVIVRKKYELTAAQTLAIVNLERECADLGLMLGIACRPCDLIGDKRRVEGNAVKQDDGTIVYTMTCNCTERTYRGTLTLPPPPRPVRDRRIDLTVRPEVLLTRLQMEVFADADVVLGQLKLVYAIRCMACRNENRKTDGCWGAQESTANQFVIECACTRRVYKGSDAPLPELVN